MKVLLRNMLALLLNLLMKQRITIPLVNYIHLNSNYKFKDFFLLQVKQPKFDFNWRFKLRNNKIVKCIVQFNKPNTWHFAVTYNWHDIGLCIVEQHINNYYNTKYAYLDIGANVGLRAVYALSEQRPTVLFDANPEVCNICKQMMDLNNYSNCKIENVGLSNKHDQLSFYISSLGYMSSFNREHALQEKIISEILIEVITLDQYLKMHPSINPKIVKIDVEGFEINVLKGAREMLEQYKPCLMIEILDTGENRKEIINYLSNYHYEAFYLFNKNEGLLEIADANDSRQNHNYLFIADKELKEYLKQNNCFAINIV
jgi:FkbM family methyltransferase